MSSSTGSSTGGTTSPQTARPSVVLLQALNVTANSATLLYNGYDPDFNDVLTYNVCLRNVSQNGSNVCNSTTSEFYQATGLQANTQYAWTVTVSDSAGQGTTVNGPLTFTTLSQQPTNLPPTLTITGLNATGNNSAIISWEATNEEGTAGLQFDICYALDRNNVLNNCADSITGGNFYELNNLMAGTTYYVTVRVREGTQYTVYANNGPMSTTTLGAPTNTGNKVPVVTLNAEQNITTNGATFSWSGSNQDSGENYTYRFCLNNELNNLLQNCSTTTATSTTRSDLTANTTYYWTVQVSDGTYTNVPASNGPRSFVTGTTSGNTNNAPTVTLTAPNNAATFSTQSVTMTWQGADQDNDTLTYSLYIKEVGQGTSVDRNDLLQGANRVLLNSPQTSYTYNVQNTNAVRNIHWMVVVSDPTTTVESGIRYFVYQPQSQNTAPTVTLTNPTNGSTQPVQTNYTLQWTGTDAEGNALVYNVYTLEVDQNATVQTYTHNQIVQQGTLRASNTALNAATVAVTAGRRLFWTVTASDGTNQDVAPQNAPFYFNVQQNNQQNGVTAQLRVTDINNNVVTTFSQSQQVRAVLTLTNTTNQAVTLNFPTQKQQEIRVVNVATGQVVRTNIPVSGYGSASSTLTIPANGTQTFTFPWDQLTTSGALVGAGQYRVEAEVSTNPVITTTPVVITIQGAQQGNTAPQFTSLMPTNGSNFATAGTVTLNWSATDVDNNPLSYELYLMNQGLNQSAPSLATVMQAGNRINIASNATSYSLTTTLGQQYFWVVTVTDGMSAPVIAGTMPFTFTVNQNLPTNAAPVVILTSPGANSAAPAVNYATAGNRTFQWNSSDADGNALTHTFYLLEVALTDTTDYTPAQVIAQGTATNVGAATSTTVSLTDQRKYWWTVTATDGVISAPVASFNSPFTFTVNSSVQTPVNLVWNLITSNTSGGAQTGTYNAQETTFVTVTVQNTGNSTQTLTFPDQNWVTVTATNVSNNALAFTQNITGNGTTLQIAAGQTVTLGTAQWNGNSLNNGRVNGNFNVTAVVNALNYNPPVPVRQITLFGNTAGLTFDVVVSASSNGSAQTSFNQNQTIFIRPTLRNTSAQTQVMNFTNNNWATVTVRDSNNAVVFSQNVSGNGTQLSLAPNGTYAFPTLSWNGVNSQTGNRVNGTYTITTQLNASNVSLTSPATTISLVTASTGGGGGGGGGGGSSSGGGGGGGTNVDVSTPLVLPTTNTGAKTWYGPIRFDNSNGEVKIPLTHVEATSGYCAKWEPDTIVTTAGGARFTGSYTPISRYDSGQVDSVIRSRLPQGASMLYPLYLQYGSLNEVYSKSVTICGTLPEDIRAAANNSANIRILGYDPQEGRWEVLGDVSNISNGRDFSFAIDKSMVIGFFEVGGSVIPGGTDGDTGNGDPIADDTFCRTFGSPFTDSKGHWGDYYVCRLYRMGIVSGYLEGTLKGLFGPDRSISRAELTKILVEMNQIDVSGYTGNAAFRDVSGNEWFAPYVAAAKANGIVDGYADGYFRPFRNINRAEAMKVVLLSSGLATDATLEAEELRQRADSDAFAGFRDIPEGRWFSSYIAIGERLGIVSGSDGFFRAGNELTRAEMAKIAFFVLELQNR